MKFHHIGIACSAIESAADFVEKVFNIVKKTDIIFDENQNANVCMLTVSDGSNIELVCGDMVNNFIKKNQYLYHVCWEVDDIEKSINDISSKGGRLISSPKPSALFHNRKVAFLFSDIGIIELLEK